MTQHRFSDKQVESILRGRKLGLTIPELLKKHCEPPLSGDAIEISADSTPASIEYENRALRHLLEELLDIAAQTLDPAAALVSPENPFLASNNAVRYAKIHEPLSSLLQRSRIIPAIRGPEYIEAALASPSVIVWLLYGTPLTLPSIVRQVRSAGKLPVANLDLLTGFAQDADGIEFLAAEGIAGVVSTRQSVLRAARSQGMIAVQRTFIVDSLAVGNIIRALQHFLPDAIELLPAAAAPLCVATLHTAQPQLPVIATGLVTTMRQVDDLIRCGVSSAATSNVSLWVL